MAVGLDPVDQDLEGSAPSAGAQWWFVGQGPKQLPHEPQQQVIEPQARGQGAAGHDGRVEEGQGAVKAYEKGRLLRLVVMHKLGGLQEARQLPGGRRARHHLPHLGNGVAGQAQHHTGQHIAADPPIPAWQIQHRGTGPIF